MYVEVDPEVAAREAEEAKRRKAAAKRAAKAGKGGSAEREGDDADGLAPQEEESFLGIFLFLEVCAHHEPQL